MKRRVLVAFGIAVALIAFVVLFGDQALQVVRTKPMLAAEHPFNMTPQPLTLDVVESSQGGTQLAHFGYLIAIPWPDKEGENDRGTVANFTFKGGQRITLLDPEKFSDLLDSLLQDKSTGAKEEVYLLFAAMTHRKFYDRLLYAHPSMFRVFMSKKHEAQLKALLQIKGIILAECSTVYSFKDGEREGFQLGDPLKDKRCHVVLFDQSDNPVEFMVGRKEGSDAVITQADVSRMIKSFRRVRRDSSKS
jgi:hypothetical protein